MGKYDDISIGDKFGLWAVTSHPFKKNNTTYVEVRCSCGSAERGNVSRLVKGLSKCCRACSGIAGRKPLINVGDTNGRLKFIREVESGIGRDGNRIRKGLFSCSCGGETISRISNVKAGRVISCGCAAKEARERSRRYKIGDRYGLWVVIGGHSSEKKRSKVLARCDCGTCRHVDTTSLYSGASNNCGCVRKETARGNRTVEGDSIRGSKYHGIRSSWHAMKKRCFSEEFSGYEGYGGRGISVCEEWLDYSAFKKWAISSGWRHGLSIERKHANKNYNPANCTWATSQEQAENKRNTNIYTHNGVDMCLREAMEKYGVNRDMIYTWTKGKRNRPPKEGWSYRKKY